MLFFVIDVCQDRGVPASNSVSSEMGPGERTNVVLDGRYTDTVGNGLISGADHEIAGCDIRESLRIRSDRKDTG